MSITINRKLYSWHDLEFSYVLNGASRTLLIDISALDWSHTVERANVYGAGRAPVGQTIGAYIPEQVTATLYKESWEALKTTLGPGYGQADIALAVRYQTGTDAVQETLIEGSILGESEGLAIGTDAITVPVLIMPTLIQTNGILMYADSQ